MLPRLLLILGFLGAARAEAQEITKMPKLVKRVEAIYPPAAIRDQIRARVELEFDITAAGTVENIAVLSSTTAVVTSSTAPAPTKSSTVADYGFVRSATTAAAQLVFEPAEVNGAPVAVRIGYAVNFEPPVYVPPPPPVVAEGEPVPAGAGIVNLRGRVRERGSRSVVPGVVVTIFRTDTGTTAGYEAVTNAKGEFEFYDLAPGEWKLLGEIQGYYPFRTSETVFLGRLTEVEYYIEKGGYNPYEVVVSADRVKKEVNLRVLSTAEIVRVPGTLGDPILVVENLPGVARPQPGSGQIIVRGSGPQDTGIFIDGIDVPLIYHFGGLRSVIPAQIVDSIEFYPGNYSVYYGRKTGGIFDAKIKKLAPDQIHGTLDVSLLDTSLYLEVPIGDRAAIAVAGRRSYVDFILNAAVPDDAAVNVVTAPRYYDYQILANWRPTDAHELRFFFLGSDDVLRLLFENPANASTELSANNLSVTTNFFRALAEYRYLPGGDYRHDIKFSVGRDNAAFSLGDQLSFVLGVLNFQVRDRAEWKVRPDLTLTGGADAIIQVADVVAKLPRPPQEGEVVGDPSFEDDIVYDAVNNQLFATVAPYVEAQWNVIPDLTLVPGLRVDYFSSVQEWSVDPRIVARWQFLPKWTAKMGVGLVHQEPQPVDTNKVFGNPDLGLLWAMHYSVGAEWQPEPHLKADVVLFYKDLNDLVSRASGTTVRDGETVPINLLNQGAGRVYGAEVYLEHKFHDNFRGWATYTLSRAERRDAPGQAIRLFDFDQTHIFNLVLSYLLPENFEVGLRWRLVSGNPFTPFVGGTVQVDLDQYVALAAPPNSGRLPLFHQLDLRVDKTWIYDWWRLSAYLSLVNTYNRANSEGFSYEFDFSRRQPVQGLPIFPILGIRGDF